MISTYGITGDLSKTQCILSSQENNNYQSSSSQSSLFKVKEVNKYNSVFSKLAYHQSIEEVSNMIRLYNNTTNNNHDALFSILTQEKYRQLASELYNLKLTKNKTNYYEKGYEKLRVNIIVSFESLLYSMYQTKIAASNKRTYEVFKKDSETLHDKEKLKVFIENLSFTSHILPEVVVSAPLMKIKPEYSLYMKKYGVPSNGIWNPDLLAEMVVAAMKIHPNKSGHDHNPKRISSIIPIDQNERINVLRSVGSNMDQNPTPQILSPQISSQSNGTVNNYVMNMNMNIHGKSIESVTYQKLTRSERKRNPINQSPITHISSPPPQVPYKEKNDNPDTIPERYVEKATQKVTIQSDYIHWEQWEMIPLAYWNSLLK